MLLNPFVKADLKWLRKLGQIRNDTLRLDPVNQRKLYSDVTMYARTIIDQTLAIL